MYIYISQSPLFGRRLEKKAREMFDDDDDALLWTGRRCVYQTFVESGNALVYHREEKKTIVVDDRYRQHKGESFLCVFLSFPLEEVKKALLYN